MCRGAVRADYTRRQNPTGYIPSRVPHKQTNTTSKKCTINKLCNNILYHDHNTRTHFFLNNNKQWRRTGVIVSLSQRVRRLALAKSLSQSAQSLSVLFEVLSLNSSTLYDYYQMPGYANVNSTSSATIERCEQRAGFNSCTNGAIHCYIYCSLNSAFEPVDRLLFCYTDSNGNADTKSNFMRNTKFTVLTMSTGGAVREQFVLVGITL